MKEDLEYELHSAVELEAVKSDQISIRAGRFEIRIEDTSGLIARIFQQGRFQLADVRSASKTEVEFDETHELLSTLALHGFIRQVEDEASLQGKYADHLDLLSLATTSHYREFGLQVGRAHRERFCVNVVGNTEYGNAIRSVLSASGLIVEAPGASISSRTSLNIVAFDHDSAEIALNCNAAAVKANATTLFVHVSVTSLTIGPLYVPGNSGCYACLQRRMVANGHSGLLPSSRRSSSNPRPPDVIVSQLIAGIVGNVTLKVALGLRHDIPAGMLLHYDLISDLTTKTRLVRSPRCDVCGVHGRVAPIDSHYRLRAPKGLVSLSSGDAKLVEDDDAEPV